MERQTENRSAILYRKYYNIKYNINIFVLNLSVNLQDKLTGRVDHTSAFLCSVS